MRNAYYGDDDEQHKDGARHIVGGGHAAFLDRLRLPFLVPTQLRLRHNSKGELVHKGAVEEEILPRGMKKLLCQRHARLHAALGEGDDHLGLCFHQVGTHNMNSFQNVLRAETARCDQLAEVRAVLARLHYGV